jgi:transcriptional regulator with XRE-family HTH domain
MSTKQVRHNGLTIRCFRIKQGDKPGDFASKAGIAYSTLDNIENERKDASVEVLYRIAAALDVPVRALLRDASCLTQDQSVPA